MPARTRTKQALLTAFGGVLKSKHAEYERRMGKELSHEAIARFVRSGDGRKHLIVGGPTLWRWEEGQVASPDPLILRELARIYSVRFEALLAVLDANRANPRLTIEEGLGILEKSTHERQRRGLKTSDHRIEPVTAATTQAVVETADRAFRLGEKLEEFAHDLLGRHAAALGLTSAESVEVHRSARAHARRAGTKKTR